MVKKDLSGIITKVIEQVYYSFKQIQLYHSQNFMSNYEIT